MFPVYLILLAATVYNIILAAIIVWKTPAYQTGKSFACYLLGIAAWTSCCAMVVHPAASHDLALWAARGTFCCATFCGTTLALFCADFPLPSPSFRRTAWVIAFLGLPWYVLAWTRFFIVDMTAQPWGDHAQVGPGLAVFGVWLVACVTAVVTHLTRKAQQLSGLERLQVRYILLGAIGMTAMGVLFNLVIPAITQAASATQVGPTRYAYWGPLSSLLVSTTTTYAIVRYRLMDIRIVVRAGIVYSVTLGTLSFLFALLVPLFNGALTLYFNFPANAGSFILAFVMALSFQPLRDNVQTLVDRQLFFKGMYDYRQNLREICDGLAAVSSRQVLTATLVNAADRMLQPGLAAVFIPNREGTLVRAASTGRWDELPRRLTDDDPLAAHAQSADEVLLADELARQPEPRHTLGQRMKEWRANAALPLIAGGSFCGMIVISEKRSGNVYSADDIALLRILGKQAAIALDNVRHYEQAEEMNEYHQRLLHIMGDGVIALDPRGRIITFNPAAARITGIAAHDAQGKRLAEIGLAQLLSEEACAPPTEAVVTTPSDVEVPVLVTCTPFRRPEDTTDNSRLLVFRDLSALRALEEEKREAERLSSLGAMAASLAHEIKNPLVPIQTFAHLLPSRYQDTDFRQEFTHTVIHEVERIDRLVTQMLDLVREPSFEERGAIEIGRLLERLLILIGPECERQRVRVQAEIAPELPSIVGVEGLLHQAFLNVLTNAAQVMPQGGELDVSARVIAATLVCRITDTGPGVPQGDLQRIFDAEYSTKPGGHGLGLTFTRRFIDQHGGTVRAECAPGSGLTVEISLPLPAG